MANRFWRNLTILAKPEVTYGSDPSPTNTDNAMLVSDVSLVPLEAENVPRDLVRSYFGASEQLSGVRRVTCSFSVEAAGSGAAGTAPPYAPLLLACAMAETVSSGSRVEYLPVTDSQGSVTLYWYDSGVRHIITGARGSWELDLTLGARPVFRFTFTGLYAAPSAQGVPVGTLTAFQRPLVVNDTNTGDITLGCTYSTGSLSSGTAYPSRGLALNLGNQVTHMPLLGSETVNVVAREATGSMALDLTAAQEVTFAGTVTGNTTQSLGLVHGTAAGNTLVVHAPAVQLIDYRKGDFNGKRLIEYGLRLLPSSGNDELRLCFK